MVRNGETWDLDEPEVNDHGLPIIHNIAEKLSCICLSSDLHYSFSEDANEPAKIQYRKIEGKATIFEASDYHKYSRDGCINFVDPINHVSNSKSDRSQLGQNQSQMLWAQQQALALKYPSQAQHPAESLSFFGVEPMYGNELNSKPGSMKDVFGYSYQEGAVPSLEYTDLAPTASQHVQSPDLTLETMFSPWPGSDILSGSPNSSDLRPFYERQQQAFQPQQQSTTIMVNGIVRVMPCPSDETINPASLRNTTF